MAVKRNHIYWIAWLMLSGVIAAWLGYVMLSESSDKTIFMPGKLSPGHHQLADACDACHSDPYGGGEVLQHSCVDCHGDERVKPYDSHPAKKFKDPRNADLLASINALQCVTCHTEHKPEITAKDGLTQPVDVCFHCHQEIAKDRPSHKGMGFDSCKDAGCHNFHNNRALYTDFLIKHLNEPAQLSEMVLPAREFAMVLDEIVGYPRDSYPVTRLDEDDIDAVHSTEFDEDIKLEWLESAHARSGVNCTACHVEQQEGEGGQQWSDYPDHAVCESCHTIEVKRFYQGKHGMRLKQGLSEMTPGQAKLQMKQDVSHVGLNCSTCHGSHSFDVNTAAVDACLGCHADEHSLAYKKSQHYALWQKEMRTEADPGTGVSCASCHMPRVSRDVSDWLSRIVVDHNQSANLSPNSKMIRGSCQHCHGLEFTLAALTDSELVENNFSGSPRKRVYTMELAERENTRRVEATAEDDDADMFGF